ncbi:MAG: malonyl-ACP O-methyltransferase BioC [Gammaproteobacteria bacterium]|nr:malonyl-ACP O-methyltransferase BioC [Gammaproteobacteria bacterium]
MNNKFDKAQIARSFSRAAKSYNQVNTLQKKVGDHLICKLNGFKSKPSVMIDVGCGTGILTSKLADVFFHAKVIGVDIALNMVSYASQCFGDKKNLRFLCADSDNLPIENEVVDVIFSNLMLQWSPDIKITLNEWLRVLKPGGAVVFSTFGLGSLKELHSVWSGLDAYVHTSDFIFWETLLSIIRDVGFKDQHLEQASHPRYFDSVYEMMLELKMLGAHNMRQDRHQGLSGRNKFKQLEIYYNQFRNHDNKLPASFEVYYVVAKKQK